MSDSKNELQPLNNFVIFQTKTGKVNIDVFFYEETLWLTQKKIAELFEKGRSTITEHLSNIFKTGELNENSVCRDFRHTAESEYDKYRVTQDQNYISDFDREIKKLTGNKDG